MRKNIFKNVKNQLYLRRFEFYPYLWYKYHKLFFNSLIFRGRKLWAFKFIKLLHYQLKLKENIEAFWVFLIAFMRITPDLILFPKKLGGTIHYMPMPIIERKQYIFAIRWVIKVIRDKDKFITLSNVTESLVEAIYKRGVSYEFKLAQYKQGMDNRHLLPPVRYKKKLKNLTYGKFIRKRRIKFKRRRLLTRKEIYEEKQERAKKRKRLVLKYMARLIVLWKKMLKHISTKKLKFQYKKLINLHQTMKITEAWKFSPIQKKLVPPAWILNRLKKFKMSRSNATLKKGRVKKGRIKKGRMNKRPVTGYPYKFNRNFSL